MNSGTIGFPANGQISDETRRLCLVTHRCRKNDGQGRVNYEIALAAVEAGWHVTFLGTELADNLANHPNVRWIKVQSSKLPSGLLKYQVFALKTARVLQRRRGEFDVIHADGFITWGATDINVAHFVHSGWLNCGYFPGGWFQSVHSFYQRLFTHLNSALERIAFRQASLVVALSDRIAEELISIGVEPKRISIIPNGTDLKEFEPGSSTRDEFGLPEGPPLFLFAGDIRTSRKNLDSVLRALVLVKDCHLVVAGHLEGSPFPALARKLGVTERVHFLGKVRNMPGLMRSVDAFVFPSRYEPFGLVLLEALASGLPVITTRLAGCSVIVGEGGAVLDNPEDFKTLACWMNELASDENLRSDIGARARRIAEDYSWDRMATQYLQLYEKVVLAKESRA